MESWVFTGIRNTKIPTYYKWLMNSGIYDRLDTEIGLRKTKGHQIATLEDEGVSSLSGGLITLFILCGGGISLAGISFILECHYLFNCIDICRRMRCTGWRNRRKNRATEFHRHQRHRIIPVESVELKQTCSSTKPLHRVKRTRRKLKRTRRKLKKSKRNQKRQLLSKCHGY